MKRGQAALEFLMTYGWAILVVLAAISALAYFGVLNPDRFLPEKCTLPAGIACLDSTGDADGVTLIIQNSFGFDMSNVSVIINGTGCAGTTATTNFMGNGGKNTFIFLCNPTSGKWRSTVQVYYVNTDTLLAHTKTGELILGIP